MLKKQLCAVVVLWGCCFNLAVANNALWVPEDQKLHYWGRHFEIWGCQLEDWEAIARQGDTIFNVLQHWSDHGVNTIAWSLQSSGNAGRFFNANGTLASEKRTTYLKGATQVIRDHHMSSIVELFSSKPDCWLESEEAYISAAEAVVRNMGPKYSTIFIVGDFLCDDAPDASAPLPLRDPAAALRVCHAMKKAKKNAMVGFAGKLLNSRDQSSRDMPLSFFASKPELLDRQLADPEFRHTGEVSVAGVFALPGNQLLRLADSPLETEKAIESYLDRIEAGRLAVRPPSVKSQTGDCRARLSEAERNEGFELLFDGCTLNGWTTLRKDWASWSVKDGELICSGGDGRWLRTRKRYSSFVLRLEYKIAKNGNSGLFIWSPLVGRSSRFGMEMQIRGARREPIDDDGTGAIYDVLAPECDPSNPPGEWNTIEVVTQGSRVQIRINDKLVQDFDADKVPALQHRLRCGVIGLQDHGSVIHFRQIRIKELKGPATRTAESSGR